ncbi:hypothetical protein ACSERG_25840 [Pseudomonas aeruginosa]
MSGATLFMLVLLLVLLALLLGALGWWREVVDSETQVQGYGCCRS